MDEQFNYEDFDKQYLEAMKAMANAQPLLEKFTQNLQETQKTWRCFICDYPIDFSEIPNPKDQLEIMIMHYCEECEAPNKKLRLTAADLVLLREMRIGI